MNLNVTNVNGKFLVDSREVAEMTGKRHGNLMRDIDGFVEILNKVTNSNMSSLEFFIEGKYQDDKGETRRKYDLTRKGCDMVANKMTGEKGVLFTATYVTKFAEMEHRQQNNVEVLSERKALIQSLKLTAELAGEMEEIKDLTQAHGQKLLELESKVDEQITLDSGDQRKVQKAVARKIYSIEQDKKQRSVLFQQLHREIKDRWAVPSYKDVRKLELTGLMDYIEAWRPVAA